MCGRFKPKKSWAELYEIFNMIGQPEPQQPEQPDLFDFAKVEILPTNKYPILRPAKAGGYEVAVCRWSLVPYWFRNKPLSEFRQSSFNTRIEDAAAKPTWKKPFARQHCLVSVASFWEWWGPHHTGDPKKRQRWEITRADNHDMVFAGIWDRAETADGPIESFSIMTTAAGEDLGGVHTREPIALLPDEFQAWLDCQPIPGVFGTDVEGEEPVWRSAPKNTFRFAPATDIAQLPRKAKRSPWEPGALF